MLIRISWIKAVVISLFTILIVAACDDYSKPVKNPDGLFKDTAALSCIAILNNDLTTKTGVYWVDPDGGSTDNAFKAFCDMDTEGGGWTLLMRIKSNSLQHALNQDAIGLPPCTTDSSECKLSTRQINAFLTHSGVQTIEIVADDDTLLPYFVRSASQTDQWPTDLECSNRDALLSNNDWKWIVTSYRTAGDAFYDTNPYLGTYTSARHYYPTPYAPEQFFFAVPGGGMRANNTWNGVLFTSNANGTVWIR